MDPVTEQAFLITTILLEQEARSLSKQGLSNLEYLAGARDTLFNLKQSLTKLIDHTAALSAEKATNEVISI